MMNTESLGVLAGFDEAVLRGRMEAEPYASLWRYFLSRWEGVIAREREDGKPLDQGSLGWHSITPMVIEAGLIHRLTGRSDALAHVEECISRLDQRYTGLSSLEGVSGPVVLSHGEVALAADLCRDALSPKSRQTFCRMARELFIDYTVFEHALGGYSSGGNIPLCRHINAAFVALTWGEECGHPAWREVVEKARDNVRQYLRHGCDKDGFSYEGSGYGHCVFLFIYPFVEMLRRRGIDDLFQCEPLLEKIPDMSQAMLLGDYSFAATTNDSGTRAPYSNWWLLLTAKHYNRPDHLGYWHAFQGPAHPIRPYGDNWPDWAQKIGVDPRMVEHVDNTLLYTFLHWDADAPVRPIEHSPLPTAMCAVGTGTAGFRTSWNKDAVFACLLGAGRSHTCFGHSHADCGHFGLAVGGEYLAIDTGRYNISEDQHNVVLVDGRDARFTPEEGVGMSCNYSFGRLEDFTHTPMVDYCKADAAHQKNSYWADRHFLFVRLDGDDAYVVLLDNIYPADGDHDFWWQLQANPDAEVEITGERTAYVRGQEAQLDVAFFVKEENVPAGERGELALSVDEKEWVWPYGREQDTSTFEKSGVQIVSVRRPRLLAIRKNIENPMLLSVIHPRRKTSSPLTICQKFSAMNLFHLEIESEQYVDTLLFAPDHGYIRIDGYYGLTECALVRRDRAGALVNTWSLGPDGINVR